MQTLRFVRVFLCVMNKKLLQILFFILALPLWTNAQQNLVRNPSFEEYFPCSNNAGDGYCYPSCSNRGLPSPGYYKNSNTKYWKSVSTNGVRYFTACNINDIIFTQFDMGWYKPRSGTSFIAISTYKSRQYATTRLSEPLEAGCKYEVSLYAKLITNIDSRHIVFSYECATIATDGLGIHLSKDSIYDLSFPSSGTFYHLTPQVENPAGSLLQDSVSYVKISGVFIANGDEEYLTIGNFRDDQHTLTFRPIGNVSNGGCGTYLIDDISVIKITPEIDLGNDITICRDSIINIDAPPIFDNYLWSTGETSSGIEATSSGEYWVKADYGCISSTDTINVSVRDPFPDLFQITADTFLCPDQIPYSIFASSGYDTYRWSTGGIYDSIVVSSKGKYSIEAKYACGIVKDTIDIDIYEPPASLIIPAKDTTICKGTSITLSTIPGFKHHLWSSGTNNSTITVDSAGRYLLAAYSPEGCPVEDSIKISIKDLPKLNIGNDTIICEGQSLGILATANGVDNFVWDDGSIEYERRFTKSGRYWAKAQNLCATVSDTIIIDFKDCTPFIPNLITPNNDNKNDGLKVVTSVHRDFKIELYNRWGQKIAETIGDEFKEPINNGIYYYCVHDPLLNKIYKGWIEVIQ